jgi:UDP-glucose 4-epimerase
MSTRTQGHPKRALGSILLTGATGFLGRHVLSALEQRPGIERVTLATYRREVMAPKLALPLDTWPLDLSGTVMLPPGIDTVIHVAGEKHDPGRMREVNSQGARRLAEAACSSGVTRFVHVSTVGVYGAGHAAGDIDEDHPHRPANAYESSKDEGERAVVEVCKANATSHVVLRPANVIGLVDGMHYPLLGLMRALARGLFTWFGPRDRTWLNYVHVEDTAAAIIHAAESATATSAYNVVCPALLDDVVRWVTVELKVPPPKRRLPQWAGHGLALGGSAIRAATKRSLPFDLEKFRELTNRTRFDPQRLVRETGFQYPIGAERLFRTLARTYREAGLA